jgi:hypothetical protein
MKPSQLKKGDSVLCAVRQYVFVDRDASRRVCTFQCNEFRGLNGPDDKGYVTMTDYDVSAKCTALTMLKNGNRQADDRKESSRNAGRHT